jgi:nitroimidazol reductase NimA-like FMN-containing flavoprotein (pyridoxamine 5'-phosphate oxidase superfamily)
MPSRPTSDEDSMPPIFRDLEHAEIEAILARNHVGRIAFTFRDRVDIQPIGYVFRDGFIYARTEEGSKLQTLARSPWVAFEVDEVDGMFDWRSVVVRGTVYRIDPDGGPVEQQAWRTALAALRSVVPGTLADNDPTPFRDVLFRMKVDEATGREAASRRTAT